MKFSEPRPFANPQVAARKIVELANALEAVQDGRIAEIKSALILQPGPAALTDGLDSSPRWDIGNDRIETATSTRS